MVSKPALANNLRISNVSLEERNIADGLITVEFDVTWDNSWRDGLNHDAAWLFMKVSISSTKGPPFYNAVLNAAGLNPQLTSAGGTASEETSLELYIPTDRTGAWLRRKSAGSGTVTAENVRLVLDYGEGTLAGRVDALTDVTVRVYGIEMVYIPTGPFLLGNITSGDGSLETTNAGDAWYIGSEGVIRTTDSVTCCYYYRRGSSGGGYATEAIFTIDADFPKGYSASYVMKYEITEGQYVAFLQTLDDDAFGPRDITSSNSAGKNSQSVVFRNTISGTASGNVATHRPDRAVSYLSYMDLAAYLDWAALRPMSELEYEKLGTGPDTFSHTGNYYVWGTNDYSRVTRFTISPEDGSEQAQNVVNNIANAQGTGTGTFYTQGDAYLGSRYMHGPVRVGMFADGSANSRVDSGAGFFGVMELSGNLWEYAVSIGHTDSNDNFGPTHGDGIISSSGLADVSDWDGTNAFVTQATGVGRRGGSWESDSTTAQPFDRQNATNHSAARSRWRDHGGRGVRDCDSTCEAAINVDL